jgi:hypothetical protein
VIIHGETGKIHRLKHQLFSMHAELYSAKEHDYEKVGNINNWVDHNDRIIVDRRLQKQYSG